ncbi:metallophosphoesterase family protein [Lignipirellula cremea]|uniref:metallophosphoesterase family protein n=1 Tax=Lignipirellula cremea TaxID=2528010 RepID=UPI00119D8AC8|nr:metallophosphoesterase family protein [Lignipirellula cremea]
MKRAILSDIHGNLEALEAVLADLESHQIDQIYCLGDIVGYGPNPRECIDRVIQFDLCILGNHDQGALFDPEGFSSGAERAIFWTRDQLEAVTGDEQQAEDNRRRLQFLGELQRTHREGTRLFVHGSARSPLNEYVFPEDIYNTRKIEKIFSMVEKHCFQGHTHVPGVFTHDCRFLSPPDIGNRYHLGEEKVMVNVGSVGQPRDGDCRSSYVIDHDGVLEFRRVEYNLEVTAAKIHAIPDLDDFLGDRLRDGR